MRAQAKRDRIPPTAFHDAAFSRLEKEGSGAAQQTEGDFIGIPSLFTAQSCDPLSL
jgi:hypothetical protein